MSELLKERVFEPDQCLDFFKEIAPIHDNSVKSYLKVEKAFLINTIRKFAYSKTHKISVLDLGVGSGRISSDLLPILEHENRLGSVVLVDPSPVMLDLCRTNLRRKLGQKSNLKFVQMTANIFINTCDQRFDIILLNLVCSVIGLPTGFFQSIYSSLNPGGLFAFSDIHPSKMQANPFFKLHRNGTLYKLRLKGYSQNELAKQAIGAGFSITSTITINEDNYRPYLLILLLEKGNE